MVKRFESAEKPPPKFTSKRLVSLLVYILDCSMNSADKIDVDQLLLHASLSGDVSLAHVALEGGANPNCRDQVGNTPLMRAAAHDDVAMLQLLVDAGADPNAVNQFGSTALIKAAIHDRVNAAKELIRCGAQTSVRDIDGLTAKDIAIKTGSKEVTAVL
ncbi:ankyrin repeat domain-containing protein [Thiobacillus sp.]|uniref:ankyrin repeat domain-containing protein n=1 Tax=Thiobacillus sp. TaxID=924 RepID=UPI003917DE5F